MISVHEIEHLKLAGSFFLRINRSKMIFTFFQIFLLRNKFRSVSGEISFASSLYAFLFQKQHFRIWAWNCRYTSGNVIAKTGKTVHSIRRPQFHEPRSGVPAPANFDWSPNRGIATISLSQLPCFSHLTIFTIYWSIYLSRVKTILLIQTSRCQYKISQNYWRNQYSTIISFQRIPYLEKKIWLQTSIHRRLPSIPTLPRPQTFNGHEIKGMLSQNSKNFTHDEI